MVPGSGPAGLAFVQELGDRIPRLLLLPERPDQVAGLASLIPGVDVHRLRPMDEKQVLDSLTRAMASSTRNELSPAPAALLIGDCRLDLAGRVFVHPDGREVLLTRAELALLAAFARRPGQVLSRDQLSVAIAGHDAEPYGRSVDMHVSRLRRKIEPDPKAPQFILTASGGGYKFAATPRTGASAGASTGGKTGTKTGRGYRKPTVGLERQTNAEQAGLDVIGLAGAEPEHAGSARTNLPQTEKRQLTVLSCELVPPVALGASVDLEELARVVHSFHRACAGAVASMDGSIVGSVGQEVLAFFGSPRAHEDDAERAVHAGFDLMATVGELAWSSGEPLRVRTGIATGLVVVSARGVIGEPSTAAPRLRNVAQPNSILVAPSTHRLLSRAFVCDGPGSYELPGVSEKVTAYVVTGRRPVESRFSSRQAPKLTEFVGREHELRQLIVLWERVQARKGQIALVCGEAGIGKSRVCEVFLERIRADPHITIRYQCSPHHTHSPLRPIIDQIEYAAGFERGDAPGIKLKKLEAALSEAGAVSLADMRILCSPAFDPDRRTIAIRFNTTAAEGPGDSGTDPACARPCPHAAGRHRACGCALGRFQHPRAVQPNHRRNQGSASIRLDEFQAGVLSPMARRAARNDAAA